MKNSLFRYLCLAVALVSCNLAGAQQKANYQLAEKFRLLEQNPIDKYSTEVRPTFINDTDCFITLLQHVKERNIIMSIRRKRRNDCCLIRMSY